MFRKIISIDLDGVLNNYNANYNSTEISSIKEGTHDFLKKLSKNYDIEIFTVRDANLVNNWLKLNKIDKYIKSVSNKKNPYSSVFLDDRAINFNGSFEDSYQKIINFKPYWK